MGFFSRKKQPATTSADLVGADYPSGPIASRFFAGVDRAASLQEPAIRSYVRKLSEKHSAKTIDEQQAVLDKQFLTLATGSGLGTGGIAALPGIGTLLSLGGIAGESVLLLEACGAYALASAALHGIDISDEQHRRALVLVTVSGASGNELVEALSRSGTMGPISSLRGLRHASGKEMVAINSTLGRLAFRQVRKRFSGALMKKVMPFGVGAVLGARANRAIANEVITHVREVVTELKSRPAASA